MEQKIIEILEEMEEQFETTGYYGSFAGYGIKRDDYQKLAERIVKLFLIPHVLGSVCDHPYNAVIEVEKGKPFCTICEEYF